MPLKKFEKAKATGMHESEDLPQSVNQSAKDRNFTSHHGAARFGRLLVCMSAARQHSFFYENESEDKR